MKIMLNANNNVASTQIVKKIEDFCLQEKIEIVENNPDIVISVGGDGTLLSTFHKYNYQLKDVKFIAVHTGHLGFYTDFLKDELALLFEYLKEQNNKTYSYPLLSIEVQSKVRKTRHQLALNEVSIRTLVGTMVCELYIDDALFEVFRGDGLCVSTPTGSTGVAKSLGGAVVHPMLEAMQLVEIAGLNNRVYRTLGSPMIFPKNTTLKLKIIKAETPVFVVDNLEPELLDLTDVEHITITLASQRIYFADCKSVRFWDRVEYAFIGEIASQNKTEDKV